MTDRTHILPSPAITSLVRRAMRRSPVHLVDLRIPSSLGDLLDRLDAAEARDKAQVADFRAGRR